MAASPLRPSDTSSLHPALQNAFRIETGGLSLSGAKSEAEL
jgi:hypothetical protein